MTRILVVEDEPAIALGLEDDLNMEGYEVEVVRDGNTAARRGREGGFDLILLDVMLPGKDGFEVCRELRRVDLPNAKMGAFDNMDDRPVTSAEWTQAEIVAKVAADAERFAFGVLSAGQGRAWVDGMTLEVVPDGTPLTAKSLLRDAPQNLNFTQGQVGKTVEGWVTDGRSESIRQGCHGSSCAAVWVEPDGVRPFGILAQTVSAAPYRGKTVRLRAWLKLDASAAGDRARMSLRVELPDGKAGAYDNMHDRPVTSSSWTQAEIVAKVAASAETINFGVISVGKGRAWVDGVTLEVVPDSTPSTGPRNSEL